MGLGVMMISHHNFVLTAPKIMRFGTDMKTDVFYIMVTKKFVTSLSFRNYLTHSPNC